MFWVGFYLPLEVTVQMCICPTSPFSASVSILFRLAYVMVLWGGTSLELIYYVSLCIHALADKVLSCAHISTVRDMIVSSIFPSSINNSYLCSNTHTTGTLDGIVFMPIWLELTKTISSHLLNYTMSCFISCHSLAESGSTNRGLLH